MRLIDADAFEVVSLKDVSDEFALGVQYAMELLDKAPTIEARPVVRDGCVFCRGASHTEKPFKVITQMGREVETPFNFCPNCGADMRGDGDG